jgi:DNA-directed RNA polymerase specialized sigma24 family protein
VGLRHLEGRPLADIAIKLKCTPQAAAATIARGLRKLREALQDKD